MTFHGLGHSRRIWGSTGAQELPHVAEVFGSHHARTDDSEVLGGHGSVVCPAVSHTPRNTQRLPRADLDIRVIHGPGEYAFQAIDHLFVTVIGVRRARDLNAGRHRELENGHSAVAI